MSFRLIDGVVRGDNQGRERFYDSRGYGRPHDGGIALAPVEAAHLLFRGDITSIEREDGTPVGFSGLLASTAVSEVAFFVYKNLRDRGFYLSPEPNSDEFVVYPRGNGPWDEAVAYRVRPQSERTDITADALCGLADRTRREDATGVLAVVDEESEVTYLELDESAVTGETTHSLSPVSGTLLSDRVLVSNPPETLYNRAFYGQQLSADHVQLSLVEAAHLGAQNLLGLDTTDNPVETLTARGRAVEGQRFDRRLRVYTALREAGLVPKTGFKFGADFRTYADVDSVDTLGHSELLIRVLPADHRFEPRDLALDVRLAHGVRKRMVFALVGEELRWLSVGRLTP